MNTRFQTLGAAAFALIAVTVSGTAVHNVLSPEEVALIPTIDGYSLLGQVNSDNQVEIVEHKISEGGSAILLANTHNFVECENTNTQPISQDEGLEENVRFWVYEFTGNEPPFTGDFHISQKEQNINPNLRSLNNLSSFKDGRRYYIMSEKDLFMSCNTGLRSTNVATVTETTYATSYLPITSLPVQMLKFSIESDRDSTLSDMVFQQEIHHEDEIFLDGFFSTISLREDTNHDGQWDTIIPIEQRHRQSNDRPVTEISFNTPYAISANSAVDFEIWGEEIDPSILDNVENGEEIAVGFSFPRGDLWERGYYIELDDDYDTYDRLLGSRNWNVDGACYGKDENKIINNEYCFHFLTTKTPLIRPIIMPQAECGNGRIEGDEECDNSGDGPGCSDSCTVEVGYSCEGEPSQCDLLIPNLPGEEEEEDTISLKGVKITENNDVVVQYSKNFETCAHIYREGIGQFDQRINFICAAGTDIESTANQSEFNDVLSVGDRVKICHGNNNKICSEYITVTGKTQSTTGSLFITQDSTPTPSHQLLGGTLGEPILRLTFYAEGEDIDVTDIQLPTHATVQSIDRLDLYRDGEAQKFAEATKGGCGTDPKPDGTTFCVNMESRQLVIPSGKDIDVIFRPRMKSDRQGGISGENFNISVDRTAMSVQARGVTSSNNLVANNADNTANGEIFIGTDAPRSNSSITGNISQSVLAKITSITNANPDANGTNVPVGISPIGQFKFAAAKHVNSYNGDNDAVLDAIRFDVNGTNVAVSATSFKLYNKADQTSSISCQPYYMSGEKFTAPNISGVYTVLCNGIAKSVVDSEIGDGKDITVVLQAEVVSANISGPRGGASTLQVSLTNFDHFTNENSNIKWIDTDQATQQRFNWIEYPETKVSSTLYNS